MEAAIALLNGWLTSARCCRLQPFVSLARTITYQRSFTSETSAA
jgi:hypothetical protein